MARWSLEAEIWGVCDVLWSSVVVNRCAVDFGNGLEAESGAAKFGLTTLSSNLEAATAAAVFRRQRRSGFKIGSEWNACFLYHTQIM